MAADRCEASRTDKERREGPRRDSDGEVRARLEPDLAASEPLVEGKEDSGPQQRGPLVA